MNKLLLKEQEVEFIDGQKLIAVWDDELEWSFCAKRICEALGLAWSPQLRKLKKYKKKYKGDFKVTVGSDGISREAMLIPAATTDSWLLSIDPDRVKKTLFYIGRHCLQKHPHPVFGKSRKGPSVKGDLSPGPGKKTL